MKTPAEYERKLQEYQAKLKEIANNDEEIARDYALESITCKAEVREEKIKDSKRWLLKAEQTAANLKTFENMMWRS